MAVIRFLIAHWSEIAAIIRAAKELAAKAHQEGVFTDAKTILRQVPETMRRSQLEPQDVQFDRQSSNP